MRILSLLLVVIVTFGAASAKAGLINNDTYSTDERSGLDWLDFSFTRSMSYSQVAEEIRSGSLQDWRFAFSDEVDEMINSHLGFRADDYYSGRQYSGFLELINLMGATYSGYDNSGTSPRYYAFAIGYVDTAFGDIASVRQFGFKEPSGYFRPSSNAGFYRDKDSGISSHAAFLVRANEDLLASQLASFPMPQNATGVPEPEMLLLFAAMLGFVGYRRMSKK